MVNVDQIEQLFLKHFTHKGKYVIDAATGMISCTGDVNMQPDLPMTQIPVPFDHVRGHFNCENNQLESLENAPLRVGLYFSCKHNPLKSLVGLPTHVGALIWITWHEHLPVLRLLNHTQFMLVGAPDPVQHILNKYKGQGKRVMLHCALDLKNAGFDGNAKW